MLSNIVYNDIESTSKVLNENNILENLLRIDCFFESYEVVEIIQNSIKSIYYFF